MLPAKPPLFSIPDKPWPPAIQSIIRSYGVDDLYQHQVEGVNMIRSGRHVIVATPTASGKTLVYNLPALENVLHNPDSKALYIFPLKALAQDQLRTFEAMTAYCKGIKPTAAIYDGDTSAWHRQRIREAPPNVILTNPEMIHLSFLAYHQKWVSFLSGLEMVVVDEVHTYRGVLGAHMAQIFKRFQRICSFYGAAPTFVFCSATVGNPAQLAEQLSGLKIKLVTESSAPRGNKHIVFINPENGPVQTAILLLKAALTRGLRTIVYTQSRKLTELIAIWAGNQAGPLADRISAYRAGFLPEERRDIEARLTKGELLKSADGKEFYARPHSPHRQVNLRGMGSHFNIVCSRTGQNKGEIDGFRAFKETHPGAIYLHKGNTYLVNMLDLNTQM